MHGLLQREIDRGHGESPTQNLFDNDSHFLPSRHILARLPAIGASNPMKSGNFPRF
jgi:hypothetical protein